MKSFLILLALAVTIALPFALRPAKEAPRAGASGKIRRLVIISPHNEAIRHEFTVAFPRYWREKTGEEALLDWRIPGGTSEIARVLDGSYLAAFQLHWSRDLKRPWSGEIAQAYSDAKIVLDDTPADDTPAQAARRAFLASDVGVGMDIFFGGGAYDYIKQAKAGRLVDSGVVRDHPSWFGPEGIPMELGGEPFRDPKGLWIGTCLASFGICYNENVTTRLGIPAPAQWADLADPRYRNSLALADPTKSSSAVKAFEMAVQQQMQITLDEYRADPAYAAMPPDELEKKAIRDGWMRGLKLLQRICANANLFTDSSQKPPIAVAVGNAAAGMGIDFYARSQSEYIARPDGSSRLNYVTPVGGSSIGVDPIGLLRGAPDPELATGFIEYVLSLEGQKLWNFKTGLPPEAGGPGTYALRRLPIRPEMYSEIYRNLRSDPDVLPYTEAKSFQYHAAWTGKMFTPLIFFIRVAAIENFEEMREAWGALAEANFPERATAVFSDLSVFDYDRVSAELLPILSNSSSRVPEIREVGRVSSLMRSNYRLAARLARESKR